MDNDIFMSSAQLATCCEWIHLCFDETIWRHPESMTFKIESCYFILCVDPFLKNIFSSFFVLFDVTKNFETFYFSHQFFVFSFEDFFSAYLDLCDSFLEEIVLTSLSTSAFCITKLGRKISTNVFSENVSSDLLEKVRESRWVWRRLRLNWASLDNEFQCNFISNHFFQLTLN